MTHPPELRPHVMLPCQRCGRGRRIELSSQTRDGRQKVQLLPRHGEYLELRVRYELVDATARHDSSTPSDSRHVLEIPGSEGDEILVCGSCRTEIERVALAARVGELTRRPSA